jgi:hypothetical protein
MSKLSLSFFTVATLCGLAGMVFGAIMAATQDFSLSPSHAHLNLVGWASLAIMGAFYQISGRGGRIGWANFILSSVGAVMMAVALGFYLAGSKPALNGVTLGTLLVILGMLAFLTSVLSGWGRSRQAA